MAVTQAKNNMHEEMFKHLDTKEEENTIFKLKQKTSRQDRDAWSTEHYKRFILLVESNHILVEYLTTFMRTQ